MDTLPTEVTQSLRVLFRQSPEHVIPHFEAHPELLHVVHRKPNYSYNNLDLAVQYGEPEVLEYLLRQGVRPVPKREEVLLNRALGSLREESEALRIATVLLNAGIKLPVSEHNMAKHFIQDTLNSFVYPEDRIETLHFLERYGLDVLSIERDYKHSIVSCYAQRPSKTSQRVLQHLIAKGCSVNALESRDQSPLSIALGNSAYAAVVVLLDHGGDFQPEENVAKKLGWQTTIDTALCHRLLDTIASANSQKSLASGLHKAVHHRNLGYIDCLVQRQVDLDAVTGGETPLTYAIKLKFKDVVQRLSAVGANLNRRNAKGQTPLDLAFKQPGFKRIAAEMIAAGAKTSAQMTLRDANTTSSLEDLLQLIEPGEAWGDAAAAHFSNLPESDLEQWRILLHGCLDNDSGKPSVPWLREMQEVVDALGAETFRNQILGWLDLARRPRSVPLSEEDEQLQQISPVYVACRYYVSDANARILRGFAWLAVRFDDPAMCGTLRELATAMYSKIAGLGMRKAKLANAALYTLSTMAYGKGVKDVVVVRAAVKYNSAQIHINRIFGKLAKIWARRRMSWQSSWYPITDSRI